MLDRIKHFISNNRILLTAIAAVVFFIYSRPTVLSLSAGSLLLLTGEFVRTWSSGHINKNQQLAKTGPYSYTRNPLYVGNFLLATGFAMVTANPFIFLPIAVSFIVIYSPTIKAEERTLHKLFADEYTEYTNKVPRFFPRFTPAFTGNNSFDWGLVKKHREFNTWGGILAGLCLFILKIVI